MSRTSFRANRAVCVNGKNPLSPGPLSWKLSLLLVGNLLCAVFFLYHLQLIIARSRLIFSR